MGANFACYTCEHYRPSGNPNVGSCTMLDDASGPSYAVESSSQECLFNLTKLPRKLTLDEAKSRDELAQRKRTEFWRDCEKVAKEVDSWPDWKKRGLDYTSQIHEN